MLACENLLLQVLLWTDLLAAWDSYTQQCSKAEQQQHEHPEWLVQRGGGHVAWSEVQPRSREGMVNIHTNKVTDARNYACKAFQKMYSS
jgi:hypothetical protein